jgi:hypothetical protein
MSLLVAKPVRNGVVTATKKNCEIVVKIDHKFLPGAICGMPTYNP